MAKPANLEHSAFGWSKDDFARPDFFVDPETNERIEGKVLSFSSDGGNKMAEIVTPNGEKKIVKILEKTKIEAFDFESIISSHPESFELNGKKYPVVSDEEFKILDNQDPEIAKEMERILRLRGIHGGENNLVEVYLWDKKRVVKISTTKDDFGTFLS